MNRCLLSITVLLVGVQRLYSGVAANPAKYVNPFIGATTSTETAGTYHGDGKTFPGATYPFGLVQLSPNTITGGDNGSGYSYEHKSIEGFAFTQMSGVGWYGDLGNFLVMPSTGKRYLIAGKESDIYKRGYRSFFRKKNETASAGYYSVLLDDHNIRAEATVTGHCGILRFTFPESDSSRIQIDLAHRVGGTSDFQHIEIVDSVTIRGWIRCTPKGGGWGHGAGNADYRVCFFGKLSKPLHQYGYWSAKIPDETDRRGDNVVSEPYLNLIEHADVVYDFKKAEGKHIGFFSEFATRKDEMVELRVGLSFVDMEGAEKNFKAEIEAKSFSRVKREATNVWNKSLRKIQVDGTKEQKIIFYTALYHTMIDPRILSDVDGRYPGGDNKIHHSDRFLKRTIFSGWDVFRSQMPLQTLIHPNVVNDELNSLITLAEESGKNYLERWEFFNAYSGCMVGDPAISVLTDACVKGIYGAGLPKAYQMAYNTAMKADIDKHTDYWSGSYSISNTLEHCYTDWCMAKLSALTGNESNQAFFAAKSKNYINIFDKNQGWFRPRNADGSWASWPASGRLAEWYGCTESNPYQQGWFVPHDIDGMVALMGGIAKVCSDLDSMFTQTPENLYWNSYYNHANEQVHHVPFIFNRIGYPWLTQKWVRFVCRNAYKNSFTGLVGNEDVGQMSAWYVLASTGLYQLCPGDTRFEITTPLFANIVYNFDNGKKCKITCRHAKKTNIYINSLKINGKLCKGNYTDYQTIISGAKLEFDLTDKPNVEQGVLK